MAKNVFSKKQIGASRHSSAAMDQLMKTGKIGKILGDRREQDTFHSELKKYSSGGVTKDELRKTLGALAKNTSDSITKGEVSEIGRELKSILGSKRMITPKEEKIISRNVQPKNNPAKEINIQSPIQKRPLLKSSGAFPPPSMPTRQDTNMPSLPGNKRPTERVSELLTDILDKKTV